MCVCVYVACLMIVPTIQGVVHTKILMMFITHLIACLFFNYLLLVDYFSYYHMYTCYVTQQTMNDIKEFVG